MLSFPGTGRQVKDDEGVEVSEEAVNRDNNLNNLCENRIRKSSGPINRATTGTHHINWNEIPRI